METARGAGRNARTQTEEPPDWNKIFRREAVGAKLSRRSHGFRAGPVALALDPRDATQPPALVISDDEARATHRAAAARVPAPLGGGEAVVKRQLVADGDVTTGDDPDPAPGNLRPAGRRTND